MPLLLSWPSYPLQIILLSDLAGCGSLLQIVMTVWRIFYWNLKHAKQPIHRKKRFASSPSPAGMSLPNSPWAGIMTSWFMYKLYRHKLYREQIVSAQITELFLPRGSLVSDIPAGDGKLVNLFLRCIVCSGIPHPTQQVQILKKCSKRSLLSFFFQGQKNPLRIYTAFISDEYEWVMWII